MVISPVRLDPVRVKVLGPATALRHTFPKPANVVAETFGVLDGVHVNVKPLAGTTVLLKFTLSSFEVP